MLPEIQRVVRPRTPPGCGRLASSFDFQRRTGWGPTVWERTLGEGLVSGICEERRTGVRPKHSTLSTHPPGQSHPQLQPPQFVDSDMCLQPGPFSPAADSSGPRGHFPTVPTSDSSHIHLPPVRASALLLAPISGHLQSADTYTLQPRLPLHCPFPSLPPPKQAWPVMPSLGS